MSAWLLGGLVVAQALSFSGRLDGARRGAGDGPTTLALDPDSGRVFVGFWNARSIAAIAPDAPTRRTPVATGHRPTQLGWLPRSRALIFACYYEDHLCVVADEVEPQPARCFVPDHRAAGELTWRATAGGHASFSHPQGTFHGHVESFVVDPATERVYALASHFSGIGLDKDATWVAPVRWDGERLVSDGRALPVPMTSHDHDAQPLAVGSGPGSLWWTSPGERVVRRFAIAPDPVATRAPSAALGRLPVAMVLDPNRRCVWIGDGLRGELRAIDAETLIPVRRFDLPAPVSALALDERSGSLWLVSRWGGGVATFDPGAAVLRDVAAIDEPSAIVVDGRRAVLWVASLGDGRVHRLATPGVSTP